MTQEHGSTRNLFQLDDSKPVTYGNDGKSPPRHPSTKTGDPFFVFPRQWDIKITRSKLQSLDILDLLVGTLPNLAPKNGGFH